MQSILAGETGKMAGEIGGRLVLPPFAETVEVKHNVPDDLIRLLRVLSQ